MRCGGVKPGPAATKTVQFPASVPRPGEEHRQVVRRVTAHGVAARLLLSTIAVGKLYAIFNQIMRRLRVSGSHYPGHDGL